MCRLQKTITINFIIYRNMKSSLMSKRNKGSLSMTTQQDLTSRDMYKDWLILIVDDTPDNLTVAKAVLKFHGANVYTASSGVEALAILEQITPTVILLDIRMPTMDGWELYRAIRENPNPTVQHIPIIALTAYAMNSDRERILGMGFDGYISKPFELAHFLTNIKDIVAHAVKQGN